MQLLSEHPHVLLKCAAMQSSADGGVNFMRPYLRRIRRSFYEAMGNPKYTPRPSLNDLDAKLANYLNYRGGFFIEVGANNGYKQSNTYYLERGLKWKGVLVEAIPELYDRCSKLRTHSSVFNCALVAPDYTDDHVTMHYADLMSVTEGSMGNSEAQQEHINAGLECQHIDNSYSVDVPVRTLESLLDEIRPEIIDFFSLDVEGYELNVLKGLNIKKYQPTFILVEAWSYEEVNAFLSPYYDQLEQLTFHDYLYRVKSPAA